MAGDAVWIDVLPAMAGFSKELTSGAAKAGSDAGKASGSAWSRAFGQSAGDGGSKQIVDELEENEKRAKKSVEQATTEIGKARASQREATARVITAEESLRDTIAKYGAESGRAAAATLRLEAARDKQTIANDRLERAETQVKAAHKEARVATDQLTKATKDGSTEAKQSKGAWDKVQGSLGDLKDGLSDASGGMAGFVTTAAGAVGVAATFGEAWNQSLDLSRGTAQVSAALGLTQEESERAGEVAGNLFAGNYGESMQDASMAVEAVISSIKGMRTATAADLEDMVGKTMSFADAMGLDVVEATSSAAQLINQGLAKDGVEALDLLSAALQNVPVALRGEVMDATHEYSQFFAMLGFDGPQAMGLLAKSAEDGQYGIDKMGDAIKEFTIRSTDMSKTTIGAYQDLGLNFQTTTEDLLAGGDRASTAFETIVTGIGKIEDPALQASTALALFGTPLEDLNVSEIPAFLESISLMNNGLGDVSGTVSEVDQKMGNAIDPLDSITRSFMEMLNDGIGPLVGPLQTFSKWVTDTPGIMEILGVGFGALTAAITVMTVAWAGMTIAASPWIVTAAVIAAAIAAAVAVIVIVVQNWGDIVDWVKEKWEPIGEWFVGLWQGIKDGTAVVVDWFQEHVLPILTGVWDGIKAGAEFMWTAIKVVFVAWATGWSLLAQGLMWVWEKTIAPMWELVKKGFKAGWDWIDDKVFRPMRRGFELLGAGFTWVKDNVILPAWDATKRGLKAGWDWIDDKVFRPVRRGVDAVGAGFTWVKDNAIMPAWNGVKSGLKAGWDWIDDKVFNPLEKGVKAIGKVFDKTQELIAKSWDKIKGAAAKPVNFIIETVYTKGIKNTWDKIADKVGLDLKLPKVNPIKMASGGVLPGYTPGHDVHDFYSPTAGKLSLSGGESIMRPEFTRAAGGEAGIHRLNALARTGALDHFKFALGGVWDKVKKGAKGAWNWSGDKVKGAWDWSKNTAESVANFVSDPVSAIAELIGKPVRDMLGKMSPGFTGDILAEVPPKFLDNLGSWAKKALTGRAADGYPGGAVGGGAGMGYKAMVEILKNQFPGIAITSTYRPGAVTAGYGNTSYHAMGRAVDMSPRMDVFNWLSSAFPNSAELLYSPANARQILRGGRRGNTSGVTRANHFNHVHWAMAQGGVLPKDLNFGTYDTGGVLPPGDTLVSNKTGLPELVLTAEQVASLGNPRGPVELSDRTIDRLAEAIAEDLGVVGETVNEVRNSVSRARTLERIR